MTHIRLARLIYKNATTGELTGIKLANGQGIGWYGDAPVAQITYTVK
ncbi:MAG: hypothetical protein ACQEXX_27155 [Bacillota bacterium]